MTAARLPCIASSDPLLLSALLSFCCAGWFLSVALPLLLAFCHRFAHANALVRLSSLPLLGWHLRQSPPPPLTLSIASVKCSRQSPSPPATASVELHSLLPSPCRSPLPPLKNADMLPPPSNAPATTSPAAIAGRRCHRAATATTITITIVVELTVVHCQRKRQQQHHHQRFNGSTNV